MSSEKVHSQRVMNHNHTKRCISSVTVLLVDSCARRPESVSCVQMMLVSLSEQLLTFTCNAELNITTYVNGDARGALQKKKKLLLMPFFFLCYVFFIKT